MSLVGKNRRVFSYNNQNKQESNFQYKDFEKTKSYHSDFRNANFSFASLRAAQMKYCNFDGALFVGTEFVGSNLRGSTFKGATFKDSIFSGAVLDKANFSGASFENCIFFATRVDGVRGLEATDKGIRIITEKPKEDTFSTELMDMIQSLRTNDIIRRSNTLHTKKNGINTVYLCELLREYSEADLIRLFPLLPQFITTQFYTLSYLKVLLKKANNVGNT